MAEYVVEHKDDGLYATCAKERIVRCRNCRRSFEERGELWCRGIVGPPIEPEGFCAWGKPREGE